MSNNETYVTIVTKKGGRMLVSLMNSLHAITLQNNACYNLMQTRNNMLGAIRNSNSQQMSFGALCQLDNQFAHNMDYYQTQYQIATAMRKQATQQKENAKLNILG